MAIKTKEGLRKYHSQEEPKKETRQLDVTQCPGWDPRTEKKYEVKTKEIWQGAGAGGGEGRLWILSGELVNNVIKYNKNK